MHFVKECFICRYCMYRDFDSWNMIQHEIIHRLKRGLPGHEELPIKIFKKSPNNYFYKKSRVSKYMNEVMHTKSDADIPHRVKEIASESYYFIFNVQGEETTIKQFEAVDDPDEREALQIVLKEVPVTFLNCSLCRYVAPTMCVLKIHSKSHMSKKYSCDQCYLRFSKLRALETHLVSVHPDTLVDPSEIKIEAHLLDDNDINEQDNNSITDGGKAKSPEMDRHISIEMMNNEEKSEGDSNINTLNGGKRDQASTKEDLDSVSRSHENTNDFESVNNCVKQTSMNRSELLKPDIMKLPPVSEESAMQDPNIPEVESRDMEINENESLPNFQSTSSMMKLPEEADRGITSELRQEPEMQSKTLEIPKKNENSSYIPLG